MNVLKLISEEILPTNYLPESEVKNNWVEIIINVATKICENVHVHYAYMYIKT